MVQISKRPLDTKVEELLFDQFWKTLSKIDTSQAAFEFFSDLLTKTEKIMLAKRFAIAILLTRGKSTVGIRDSIHVSSSTINSVSSWVKNANPNTHKLLSSLSAQKDWEGIVDKIDEILDKIPPRPGTNWGIAGKEKWKRTKERSAKRTLK